MPDLGARLEAARVQLAMSQGTLASILGVTQQTVSRWEKGQSVPTGQRAWRLTQILDLPTDLIPRRPEGASSKRRPVEPEPAVRPLLSLLPFDQLAPDQFELFVADLAQRRYPGASVTRIGGQGDSQRGYDIIVTTTSGTRIGIQCKREKQFGPKKVQGAVAAADLEVEESVIALSHPATGAAVLEIDKHPGWEFWDQEKLSRQTRLLSLEDAESLVRSYFMGHLVSCESY